MKSMIFAMIALSATAPAAAQKAEVRVYTREGAYATKITDRNAELENDGSIRVHRAKNPWRTVSQEKWARDIDPALRQASWSLSAKADYDSDGKTDTAKIYTNGKQTAVIVGFGSGKPSMVIYKADGVVAGLEVMGKGKRFLVSVPEIGYRVLALHKGKPVSVAIGD